MREAWDGPKKQILVVTGSVCALVAGLVWLLILLNNTQSTASQGNNTASQLCKRAHDTFNATSDFRTAFKDYVASEVTFRANQAAAFETVFAHLGTEGQKSVVGLAIQQLASLSANQGTLDSSIAARVKPISPPACSP